LQQLNKATVVQILFLNCIGINVYTCLYVNKQIDRNINVMSSIKCQCRSILCLRNEEKHKSKVRFVEEFEDTKGVIRIHILKKDRQHNGQKKKYRRTNNDLQNIHIKLKIE
jgi:hypothetical protein